MHRSRGEYISSSYGAEYCRQLVIGSGIRDRTWFSDVFKEKDRTLAGDTAASAGLYLVGVQYPEAFNIPQIVDAPTFMSLSI